MIVKEKMVTTNLPERILLQIDVLGELEHRSRQGQIIHILEEALKAQQMPIAPEFKPVGVEKRSE